MLKGDTLFANPNMAALNAGSICGSHPFVSSRFEGMDGPHPWTVLPCRGNEEDRLAQLKSDANVLGHSMLARIPTMSHVAQGRSHHAPHKNNKARDNGPHVKSMRRNKFNKKVPKKNTSVKSHLNRNVKLKTHFWI